MERRSIFWPYMAGYFIGFGIATTGGIIRDNDHQSEANERVRQVQEHNLQIDNQLKHDFPGMGRLILNDKTDTYEFHLPSSETEPQQTCEGTYQVKDQKALPIGDITCKQIVRVDN